MKIILILITGIFSVFAFQANAQSGIDSVLVNVARNNKTILAKAQYWEAQKVQFRTGITPYNPTVEYDYLQGSPVGAGNQTDFSVTQAFDFPTSYFKKNQLAALQTIQAEYQFAAARQDALLEAKNVCIELVYRNKLQVQIEGRKQNTEKLLQDFRTKLDKGDGNILDVNKAQLQLIEIKRELWENTSAISQLNEKLTSLNGGVPLSFVDTGYFFFTEIPSFEDLEKDYENNDPLRKILEQEQAISQKQLELSRALWLPKIEVGYHYQGILGQVYSGVHTGISIPLWENKNTTKLQHSKMLLADLELQNHRNEHYFEIKQLYEKYLSLKTTLTEYTEVFKTINSTVFLDKALGLGQISTIEYFMEVGFYYNAHNNYLLVEKEYNNVISMLFKYRL